MEKKNDILKRVFLVYVGVLVFSFAVVFKIISIQVNEGDELKKKAQKMQVKLFSIKAIRGNILSDDGTLMAVSVPKFDVYLDLLAPGITDKVFNKNVDGLAKSLSNLFKDRSIGEYKRILVKKRNSKSRYSLLKRGISYVELQEMKTFPILNRGRFRGGLIIKEHYKRIRPFRSLAMRTIGYESRNDSVSVGLEGAFSKYLTGKDGRVLKRKLNHGAWKPLPDAKKIEAKDGLDIQTTLDVNLQDVAQHALLNHLKSQKAFEGCAIVMEVETGFVKAIANYRFNEDTQKYEESYNMAIGKAVEPGSTFKLASMIVGIEDGLFKLDDKVDISGGRTRYYDRIMRDVHFDGEDKISLRKAFEKSSNVGISKIVWDHYKDNPKKFVAGLKRLGLDDKLNLDIAGEGKPVLPDPNNSKKWYGTSLPWLSIGYGVTLTPFQILSLYNSVANNGTMVKPQFVKRILQRDNVIKEFEPVVLKDEICSERTIDSVKSLLEGVVINGTGRNVIKNPFYLVAGKTGTAQIAKGAAGYNKSDYNASFCGYFPADNPRYSCIVVVNNPKAGKIYGSSVAGPVFKEIADKIYALDTGFNENPHHGMLKDYPIKLGAYAKDLENIFALSGIQIDNGSVDSEFVYLTKKNKPLFKTRQIREKQVPNLKGMSSKDALFILERLGLDINISGRGNVVEQSLSPGTRINKGQKITIKLSI
ncbi:MAG: penicillin-binding protein [Hyphomicrobiales bacterium]